MGTAGQNCFLRHPAGMSPQANPRSLLPCQVKRGVAVVTWHAAAHLLDPANDKDAVDHHKSADEEVERHRRVAVPPQKGHQEAEAQEDHHLHVQEPLVVQRDFLTAQHTVLTVTSCSHLHYIDERASTGAKMVSQPFHVCSDL